MMPFEDPTSPLKKTTKKALSSLSSSGVVAKTKRGHAPNRYAHPNGGRRSSSSTSSSSLPTLKKMDKIKKEKRRCCRGTICDLSSSFTTTTPPPPTSIIIEIESDEGSADTYDSGPAQPLHEQIIVAEAPLTAAN